MAPRKSNSDEAGGAMGGDAKTSRAVSERVEVRASAATATTCAGGGGESCGGRRKLRREGWSNQSSLTLQ
eukprot:1332847-Alexandrium_andersonii.AAC.1